MHLYIFLFIALLLAMQNNAMNRKQNNSTYFVASTSQNFKYHDKVVITSKKGHYCYQIKSRKDHFSFQNSLNKFEELPVELKKTVLQLYLQAILENTKSSRRPMNLEKKITENVLLKSVMQQILRIKRVNKMFFFMLNGFSEWIIYEFSKKLTCPHEIIASQLATANSYAQLRLQLPLRDIATNLYYLNRPPLNDLITQGINLQFTYVYKNRERTASMIAIRNNPSFFRELLKHPKFNPNECTSTGFTLLHHIAESPELGKNIDLVLNHPMININQQDCYGVTPLLYVLTRSYFHENTFIFTKLCKKLLDNGADPTIANHEKQTPLHAAQQLKNHRVITMIKNALNKDKK